LAALVLSLLSSIAGTFAGLATYICWVVVFIDRGFSEEYPVIWAYVLVAIVVLFFSAITTFFTLYGGSKKPYATQANS
jgi:ABC-type multidrug transport system fused ATPase/permease subunit